NTSEILRLLEQAQALKKYRQIDSYFPAEGPLRRELYRKHLEFFAAGKKYRERAFIAANRVGKTLSGSVEMRYHLTGEYPNWWEGRRFTQPIVAWGRTTQEWYEAEACFFFGCSYGMFCRRMNP